MFSGMDDCLAREAYEERREDERRQEREREEAYRQELLEEDARRLARYDEAIRLLRECGLYTDNAEFDNKVIDFLATEPKGDAG